MRKREIERERERERETRVQKRKTRQLFGKTFVKKKKENSREKLKKKSTARLLPSNMFVYAISRKMYKTLQNSKGLNN